jgi:hypothetical protein
VTDAALQPEPNSIFLIDFDAMLQTVVARSTDASTAFAFFTPGYIVFIVGNWLLTVAGVVFAVLDYRTLTARGVPRPFHWAFSVFVLAGYGIVYPIGRGVIVQMRTGKGMAPTVAAILVYSAGFVIGLVWTVMLVTQILTVIPYLPPVPVS